MRCCWQPATTITKDNGENAVAQKKPKHPMTEADRRKAVFNRIQKNDKSAVPEFREMMKEYPAIAETLGNMAKVAERSFIESISQNDLLASETLTVKLAAMRAELAGPQPSPIERLLVERVVACWFQVYAADAIVSATKQCTFAQGDYNQRCQDRSHRRYLSAIRTLATVRKLALPIRVDLNVAGSIETKEAEPAPASRPWRLPVGTNN
jgi:hypothetical protein